MTWKKAVLACVIVVAAITLYLYARPSTALQLIVPDVKKVNLLDVRFRNDSVLASLDMQMKNRSILKINIQDFSCRLMLDTMPFMEIKRSAELRLSPGKSAPYRIPLHFSLPSLQSLIANKQKSDSILVTAQIQIEYSTWFGKATLPRIEQVYISVPRPPQIEILGTRLKGVRKGNILVDALLKVSNPGKLSLWLKKVRYNVKIEDVAVADQTAEQDIRMLARTDSVYVLPMQLKLRKPLSAVMSAVTGRQFNYTADIRAMLYNDSIPGRHVPVHLVKSGLMQR